MRNTALGLMLGFAIYACSSDSTDKSCGPNPCGACPPGCGAVDVCQSDGTWNCTCSCNPKDAAVEAGCGGDHCNACAQGCTLKETCGADGAWICECDCPDSGAEQGG